MRIECDRCGCHKPRDAFYARDGVCITCRIRARRAWCVACAGMPHRVQPPIAGARCETCGLAYEPQPELHAVDFADRRKDSGQALGSGEC